MKFFLKNRFIYLFVFVLTVSHCGSHDAWDTTHQVASLDKLVKHIPTLTKDDLVIWDVDGVLAAEASFYITGKKNCHMRERLFGKNSRMGRLSKEKQYRLKSIYFQQATFPPVEVHTPCIIKQLQERGIKTIALTALNTGPMGVISRLEDWRITKLKDIGYDFSSAFNIHEPLILQPSQVHSWHKHHKPAPVMYKQGIVFAGVYSKGDVLTCFLDTISWKPKRIIFIDDKRSYVDSVAQACKKLDIVFMGLHYTAAEKIQRFSDEPLAVFQVNYLIDHEMWLPENKAKELMVQPQP